MSSVRRCRRCLLPDAVASLRFDDTGLCDICQSTPPEEELRAQSDAIRAEMEAIIEEKRGATPYDCVLAFSGGKDSSYTLQMLVEEYKLRVIAITIDNGFLSSGTLPNCQAVCGHLGVDHVLFTPNGQFMQRMYRTSAVSDAMHAPSAIQRASSICSSCINLVNTYVLQKALELGAPLVAGGYLAGQLPKDSSVLTVRPGKQVRLRTAMVNRFAKHFGDQARPYFSIVNDNPTAEITVINPMLAQAITEEEILATLTPMGWSRPVDTGKTSTNCRLNDLGVYVHSRRHGFHPYAFEIAEQLRHGVISRDEALTKLETLPSREEVDWIVEKIGLDAHAL